MEGKSIPAEELQDPRSQGRGALGVFKNQKENHWLAFLVEVQTAKRGWQEMKKEIWPESSSLGQ
jgi:hypothetical protein